MKKTNFLHTGLLVLALTSLGMTSCHHGENLRPEPPAKEHLENLGFTEISYGGSLYEKMGLVTTYGYDNYLKIYNPTDEPIVLDGLALVISSFKASEYLDLGEHNFFSTHISGSRVMVFPGNGNEYKIEPKKSITVAAYAVDHTKESKEYYSCKNSIDLSSAALS